MGNTFSQKYRNPYDWTPDLPDFRDDVYKYPKLNLSRLENSSDLRSTFKEYTSGFGSSAANCIAAILDSYNIHYTYLEESDASNSIRNCIKRFKTENGIKYYKINNFKNQLCQSLNDEFPILFGFTVYESFLSDEVIKTGVVPVPNKNENVLGGICLIIVGYDGKNDTWIVKHPLGKNFGDDGYLYISADILTKNNNISTDFWSIC